MTLQPDDRAFLRSLHRSGPTRVAAPEDTTDRFTTVERLLAAGMVRAIAVEGDESRYLTISGAGISNLQPRPERRLGRRIIPARI